MNNNAIRVKIGKTIPLHANTLQLVKPPKANVNKNPNDSETYPTFMIKLRRFESAVSAKYI